MPGVVRREPLREAGRVPSCVPEPSPHLGHEELSPVPPPAVYLAQPTFTSPLNILLSPPLPLIVSRVRLAPPAVAVHRVPGALRPVLVHDPALGHQRRRVIRGVDVHGRPRNVQHLLPEVEVARP